ncbi:MAG: hypothetical protein NT003_02845 [Candidatus Magasanikbacteria bacterium]|nr:hypothetical protein [Candidatus Magasanikbacteria bacterium]
MKTTTTMAALVAVAMVLALGACSGCSAVAGGGDATNDTIGTGDAGSDDSTGDATLYGDIAGQGDAVHNDTVGGDDGTNSDATDAATTIKIGDPCVYGAPNTCALDGKYLVIAQCNSIDETWGIKAFCTEFDSCKNGACVHNPATCPLAGYPETTETLVVDGIEYCVPPGNSMIKRALLTISQSMGIPPNGSCSGPFNSDPGKCTINFELMGIGKTGLFVFEYTFPNKPNVASRIVITACDEKKQRCVGQHYPDDNGSPGTVVIDLNTSTIDLGDLGFLYQLLLK